MRLRKIAYYQTLNNFIYENENFYKEIDQDIENMKISLDIIDESNDYDIISDELYNIIGYADDIKSCAFRVKDNGINNENYLSHGNDIINDLQKEIDNLQTTLENLEDQYNEIINRTAYKTRLIHKYSKKHSFICNAHDGITESAEKIKSIANETIDNLFKDLAEFNIHNYVNSITDEYDSIIYDLDQAKEMNQRMGNGIDKKNSTIDDLQNQIEEINQLIKDKENEISYLENQIE